MADMHDILDARYRKLRVHFREGAFSMLASLILLAVSFFDMSLSLFFVIATLLLWGMYKFTREQ